jgi:glycerol kinase
METDSGVRLKELRVDGGASKNDFLMQFQADILNVDVVRPQVTETTALGAAYLAGLAVGYWKNVNEIASQWSIEKRFKPNMRPDQRKQLLKGWTKAVQCSKGWAKET